MMPPGTRTLAFASRWFEPAIVASTFEPLIADWQREWDEAPRSHRLLIRVRGVLAFIVAMAMCSASVLRTPAPVTLTNRIAFRVARFTLIGSVVAMLPALWSIDVGGRWYLFLLLVPSTLPLFFPFAMIGAADEIRTQDDLPPHVARAAALKIALFSVCLMLAYGGFVVPAANRAWRVATSPDRDYPPVAGVRELSTFTLLTDASRAPAYEAYTGSSDRTVRIRRELQQRLSLALLPLTLLWLRWSALDAPRRGWFRPLPATAAVTVALAVFLITFFTGWRLELALLPGTGAGVWLPIVTLSFIEGLLGALRKRTA